MSKITITEDKLTSLIEESVYELLQEAETDERLGHWLGNAFQSIKNRWNRFKGDINAGIKHADYRDRNMNSWDKYSDEEKQACNFDKQAKRDYRYGLEVGRNQNADTKWTDQFGNTTTSWKDGRNPNGTVNTGTEPNSTTTQPETTNTVNNTTPTPNPNTTTQNTTAQNNATTNTTSQPNSKRNQAKYNNIMSQQNKIKQQMQQIANYLTDKKNNHNFRLVNGEWVTNGTDGGVYKASESGYNDIRTRAIQYKQLQARLNKLKQKIYTDKIIQESVDKVLKQYAKKKMK